MQRKKIKNIALKQWLNSISIIDFYPIKIWPNIAEYRIIQSNNITYIENKIRWILGKIIIIRFVELFLTKRYYKCHTRYNVGFR